MNRTLVFFAPVALALSGGGVTVAQAQSAWLPSSGELIATPGFTFQTFDEFWIGDTRASPLDDNDESLDQYTGFLSLEYGITDSLAVDVTAGYTETSSTETFGNSSDAGWADTVFGLRYRLLEESDVAPIVAVRVGGIIAGSYDANLPFSAGDGANGVEGSLLFGKTFGASGFGAYGDVGYRFREDPVPDDVFGSVGLFKQFTSVFADTDALTATFGYRHVQSTDGIDIAGPGFNPPAGASSGFPALEEINQLLEASLSYTDVGRRQYQLSLAKSVDGRNTGDKLVLVLAVSIPFGGR